MLGDEAGTEDAQVDHLQEELHEVRGLKDLRGDEPEADAAGKQGEKGIVDVVGKLDRRGSRRCRAGGVEAVKLLGVCRTTWRESSVLASSKGTATPRL